MLHRVNTIALMAIIAAWLCAACQPTKDTKAGDEGEGAAGTTSTTSGASAGGGSSSGSGGDPTCGDGAVDATVQKIAKGEIGPEVDVKLDGVVAMSQKFLVSKSSTGSCLWGVFVSAPDLQTTAEYTGLLALSYGTPAAVPEGGDKAYCPKLGEDPAGDRIPDDVQPGDVLNIIGETSNFLLSNCANEPKGSQVPQRQLAKVCSAQKVGTASVPKAMVMPKGEIEDLGSAIKTAFHDKWGGVKVRIEDVTAQPVDGMSVVGDYGVIALDEGVEVGDKIYYRGYQKDPCHTGPQFDGPITFTAIEGFHYLSYCTWGLQPNDKCSDFDPKSGDCTADSCAPY